MDAEDRIDKLEAALHHIVSWAEAYPLSVFPEPDMVRANELLEAGGISLAAVSACMARHIVSGIGEIAREVLE